MKKNTKSQIIFLILTFCLHGCASPELRRWEGKKFTLCCAKDQCSKEKWQKKEVLHCPGAAKVIGGGQETKITGFTLSGAGADKYNNSQTVQAQQMTEECRIYLCTHDVIAE